MKFCFKNSFILRTLALLIAIVIGLPGLNTIPAYAQSSSRIIVSGKARQAIIRNQGRVGFYLNDRGTALGQPVFLRIIRNTKKLELYIADRRGNFRFIRHYSICGRSAVITQTPMGIYKIGASGLGLRNPEYLQIGVNFPNPFQLSRKTSGTLQIQARCNTGEAISINDTEMEELFTIIYAAMGRSQREIPLYILPFELSAISVFSSRNDPNHRIIRQLETINSRFEATKKIPEVRIDESGYHLLTQSNSNKKRK